MRVIAVAFDSFKGSLSSAQAAEAFAQGWREVYPECEVRTAYIADGGEGMTEALVRGTAGGYVKTTATGPLGDPISTHYGIINDNTAVIEIAAAAGLTLLNTEQRNPLYATTYGTGEMIMDALRRGCKKIILGLGGSATNDGGSGMLRALGFHFYNTEGQELIDSIEILEQVATIDSSHVEPMVWDMELRVAVDVDNPLYGERGAAVVFAPQKGADKAMVERLDRALRHYAAVAGEECASMAGSGAAGGVGYGILALLGAQLQSGIELILEVTDFKHLIADAELIVTGEGRIDNQTLMGKAPAGVLRYAQRLGVPCIAVGGSVLQSEELRQSGFEAIYASTPETMPLEEALQSHTAYNNLKHTARKIALAMQKLPHRQ
jgi:glycerate kinase